MLKNLPLSLQGFILVSIPLLCELVFVGTLAWQLHLADVELKQVERARDFREATEELVHHVYRLTLSAQNRDPGSAANLLRSAGADSGRTQLLEKRLSDEMLQIDVEVQHLQKLAFDPEQTQVIDELAKPVKQASGLIYAMRTALRNGDYLKLVLLGNRAQHIFSQTKEQLFNGLDKLITVQKKVEARYSTKFFEEQPARGQRITILLLIGVAFNLVLAVFLLLFFNRDTSGRFRVLMDNTRRLATGQALNPPMCGRDEIAHLDRVLNDMALALAAARHKERAIIENALDVICSFDESGIISAMSPASLAFFGYEHQELIGKSFTSIIYQKDLAKTEQSIASIKHGSGHGQFENRVQGKNGSVLNVQWAAQWSEAERSMFCVVHDITERKEIERIKQEFVAMVSHDLRTPLTSIQAFLSLLSTGMYGELTKKGLENLALADTNTNRLIVLVNDLLDMEKMEQGKLQLDLADIELNQIFAKAVAATLGLAERCRITLIAEDTNLKVFADGERLVQVLVNLISNAVKFSPADSRVNIQAHDSADYVEVQITDRGRGVPAAFQEVIFERFRQVESSDAKEQGGSGLGLAICKAIVEAHYGCIGVNSQEGAGSTFWLRLPKPVLLKPKPKVGESIELSAIVRE